MMQFKTYSIFYLTICIMWFWHVGRSLVWFGLTVASHTMSISHHSLRKNTVFFYSKQMDHNGHIMGACMKWRPSLWSARSCRRYSFCVLGLGDHVLVLVPAHGWSDYTVFPQDDSDRTQQGLQHRGSCSFQTAPKHAVFWSSRNYMKIEDKIKQN